MYASVALLFERPQSLIAQTENTTGLSSGGNLDLDFVTTDGRDALCSAKHKLMYRHLDFAVQIVAFAAEEIVRLFGNHHQQVAASTAARTAVAFATQVQVLAFAHACRNLDGDFFALLDAAFAMTMRARIGNHLATEGGGEP